MANFSEIANKKLAEVERPPLPPMGMYRWQVTKPPVIEEAGAGGAYTSITIPCKAIEAYDNVDTDELSAFGGIKNVVSSVKFLYDNNDATKGAQTEFRIRQFLEKHCAIEGVEEMTIGEGLAKSVGGQFDGTMNHRPDKNDPEMKYAEIQKTAPVRE
jgi:hypothetical protein